MELNNILEIIAIVLSPIIAVGTTLWYQSLKEKRDEKRKLFFNLMAHRKLISPTQQYVDALNMIDVVFYNTPTVISHWRTYFDYLNRQPFDAKASNKVFLDLLAEMAKEIGYKNLKQTKMDDFYVPNSHGWTQDTNEQIRFELLRVLQNSESYSESRKKIEKK